MYHSAMRCWFYFFVVCWFTVANSFGLSRPNGHRQRIIQHVPLRTTRLSMVSYSWSHSVSDVISEADETNVDHNHDQVTYRVRSGEVLHIPQGVCRYMCPLPVFSSPL